MPPVSHKPRFDSAEIARLEEARALRAMTGAIRLYTRAHPESGIEMIDVCGGAAIFAGVRGFWTQAVGVGMQGPVPHADCDRIIEFYESRGVTPRIGLNPYADRAFVRELTSRSFVIEMFEHVLAIDLRAFDPAAPDLKPLPDGYTIERIKVTDETLDDMAGVQTRASRGNDEQFREERLAIAIAASHPDLHSLIARDSTGSIVATAGLDAEASTPLANLFGGSVDFAHQGRGIQAQLMLERLKIAKDMGIEYAAVGSRAGITTERNAKRLGFEVAYTKAEVVKPSEGLPEPM